MNGAKSHYRDPNIMLALSVSFLVIRTVLSHEFKGTSLKGGGVTICGIRKGHYYLIGVAVCNI